MGKRNNAMDLEEKLLYQHIHPVKLIADAGVTIPCLYLIWQHHLVWGIIVLVPGLVVSLLIIQFTDLEKIKQSSFGKYNAKYMTRQMQAARFAGFLIMAIGSWYHLVWSIPLLCSIVGVDAWHNSSVMTAEDVLRKVTTYFAPLRRTSIV